MKQHFSTQWNASRQPRKQRKYLANAPLHIKHRMLSANLSKELRKKYGKRSFPLRKGDEIKIMRGEFKKKTGKIDSVDLKNLKASVENIQRNKKDGTKIKIYFHPSNLQIKELNLEDRRRKEALERKLIPKKSQNKNVNAANEIKKVKTKPKEAKKHAPKTK
jgi:large subunit ribosomal protein L24